jgi:hypothetical protein
MSKRKKRNGKAKDIFEGLPNTISQHTPWIESLGFEEEKDRCSGRIEVRIERLGVRLLDEDNLYGGTKSIVDAMRYAGLIPDDNRNAIKLIVTQRKVKRKDSGTLIQLTRL